jgi:hypothetical protein
METTMPNGIAVASPDWTPHDQIAIYDFSILIK